MKERPILFSAPMVRAILEGHKTQTRRRISRVAKIGQISELQRSDTSGFDWTFRDRQKRWHDLEHDDMLSRCQYGQPGDRLWVRETFAAPCVEPPNDYDTPDYLIDLRCSVIYRVYAAPPVPGGQKKNIAYRVNPNAPVRDELRWRPSIYMPRWASRVDLEIVATRCERLLNISKHDARAEGVRDIGAFFELWQQINGRGSHAQNPFVWVVEFRRVLRGAS